MYLVAEYCRGPFYMGWHLYLREHRLCKPNSDGTWGWLRGLNRQPILNDTTRSAIELLRSIGIEILGDGTTDDDGIAEFARRFPVHGRRCGGKKRGCVEVGIDTNGEVQFA